MSNTVIEIAEIKLGAGKTVEDLLAASESFQRDFLAAQPGFLRRELVQTADGSFADIVLWRDEAAAMAIMEKVPGSAACQRYFSVMEMSGDPEEGLSHYQVLASHAA